VAEHRKKKHDPLSDGFALLPTVTGFYTYSSSPALTRPGQENSARSREMVDFGGEVVANGCFVNLLESGANEHH
jgi:hypothetical protein